MKTGNTSTIVSRAKSPVYVPQWSPAMKTGNTASNAASAAVAGKPQWSPAMKTGNTGHAGKYVCNLAQPQWSPAMKTGNTAHCQRGAGQARPASMEPGHEDREYEGGILTVHGTLVPQWSPAMKTGNTVCVATCRVGLCGPQWSPAMKTGNTSSSDGICECSQAASMEPGHEDREYHARLAGADLSHAPQWSPAMKTGNTRSHTM